MEALAPLGIARESQHPTCSFATRMNARGSATRTYRRVNTALTGKEG